MNKKYLAIGLVIGLVIILSSSLGVSAVPQHRDLVVTGLDGSTGAGSTIGPDGKLYIAEGAAGRISRVDPWTGDVTTFTEGLPAGNPAIGI